MHGYCRIQKQLFHSRYNVRKNETIFSERCAEESCARCLLDPIIFRREGKVREKGV